MNSLNRLLRGPFAFPLLLALITGLLQLVGEQAVGLFKFQREAVLHGELWRLASGGLVHLGWNHWLLNSGGLLLITLLCYDVLTWGRWLLVFFISVTAVSLGILLAQSADWYVGLSGPLHGVLVAAALLGFQQRKLVNGLILVMVAAKLGWESSPFYAASTAAFIGGPIFEQSHLYGAIGGVVSCIIIRLLMKPLPHPCI